MRRQETAGQGFAHKTIKARKLPAYPLFLQAYKKIVNPIFRMIFRRHLQTAFFANKNRRFPACLL